MAINYTRCATLLLAFVFCLLLLPGNTHAAPPKPIPASASSGSTPHQLRVIEHTATGKDFPAQQELPKVLYRGDPRSPDEYRKLGGIPTKGPTTNESYSLDVHHRGEGKFASAYTSTLRWFAPALAFAVGMVSGPNMTDRDGWVYRIHPTPNMIDMDKSEFILTYAPEGEFSAMGGILWDQIEAWMFLPKNITDGHVNTYLQKWRDFKGFEKDFPEMKWVKNNDYNQKYDPYSASGGQPQLAGDRANLEKYKEKTLEQWAVKFMTENGKVVGWNGSFPLLKPT